MATINGDIPSITVTGVPITPMQDERARATDSGDVSWMDQIFNFALRGGSAYLDYELQSRTIDDNMRRQQQYGTLYSSPGSFFPVTGQGPNGQVVMNPQFMTLAVLAVAGVAGYMILKNA